MSGEEQELVIRRMAASLTQAIADAERELLDADVAEYVRIAELAVRGIQVVPWNPPGPAAPLCLQCRRTDRWYQRVDSGVVRCECALAA